MPRLPLPVGPSTLAGGDLPVSDAADVLAEFPRPHRNPDTAVVRDAFAAAFADGHIEYQCVSERSAARCDPLRATGEFLRSKAGEYDVIPAVGESNDSVRQRMFSAPLIVTPDAIEAAVNGVIVPRTCRIAELEMDGWFVHSGSDSSVWDSFIGAEPEYPDRLYDAFTGLRPGGAVPASTAPRRFHVRIPVLDAANENFAFVSTVGDGPYVGTGAFFFEDAKTADELYAAIIGRVQAIKGQGISWSLSVDPNL